MIGTAPRIAQESYSRCLRSPRFFPNLYERLLASDPLSIVVEVGRDATEVVEDLVPLPLGVLEAREELLHVELELGDVLVETVGLGGRRLGAAALLELGRNVLTLVGHVVFAASSSSITS